MKHFLFIVVFFVTALAVTAQVNDDIYGDDQQVQLAVINPAKPDNASAKEQKEREKSLKQRVDSLAHAKAAAALERGYWVLLADRISIGYSGYTVSGISGNSNFVFQQANEGMVQFAYNQASPGLNGMGGMTLEGKVSNIQLSADKKGNLTYSYRLVGEDINAQVDIVVYATGDYAQANVQPLLSGPRITISGRLVPYIRPRH